MVQNVLITDPYTVHKTPPQSNALKQYSSNIYCFIVLWLNILYKILSHNTPMQHKQTVIRSYHFIKSLLKFNLMQKE